MTERDARDEIVFQEPANGNGKSTFTTNRRGIMKAMALSTVATAAASIALPTASADAPTGQDENKPGQGKVSAAAAFPITRGFSYLNFTGADFHSENSANDHTYINGGIIYALAADTWTVHLDVPHGSIIREVVVFYIDNSAGANIAPFLTQYDTTAGTFITVANFASTGANPAVQAGVLTIVGTGPFPLPVDLTTFAYRLNVTLPATNLVQLVGARVGYSNAGVLTILPTPDRFIDTRTNVGGVQGPLAANTTKNFQITGRAGEGGVVIPDAATAVIGTLTAIGTGNSIVGSFLTVWPTGAQPPVSNVNYGPGSVLATQFTSGLAPGAGGHGYLNVFNRSEADYLLDVVGYIS